VSNNFSNPRDYVGSSEKLKPAYQVKQTQYNVRVFSSCCVKNISYPIRFEIKLKNVLRYSPYIILFANLLSQRGISSGVTNDADFDLLNEQ